MAAATKSLIPHPFERWYLVDVLSDKPALCLYHSPQTAGDILTVCVDMSQNHHSWISPQYRTKLRAKCKQV